MNKKLVIGVFVVVGLVVVSFFFSDLGGGKFQGLIRTPRTPKVPVVRPVASDVVSPEFAKVYAEFIKQTTSDVAITSEKVSPFLIQYKQLMVTHADFIKVNNLNDFVNTQYYEIKAKFEELKKAEEEKAKQAAAEAAQLAAEKAAMPVLEMSTPKFLSVNAGSGNNKITTYQSNVIAKNYPNTKVYLIVTPTSVTPNSLKDVVGATSCSITYSEAVNNSGVKCYVGAGDVASVPSFKVGGSQAGFYSAYLSVVNANGNEVAKTTPVSIP